MNLRTLAIAEETPRGFCLTEISLAVLVSAASGLSVVLWCAIIAVL